MSAELPDPATDPEGHRVIAEFMMHGPCGLVNKAAPCMRDSDTCKKNFPKPFCPATFIDDRGYVHYRRRSEGIKTVKQGIELDNGYVVPHNRSLCMIFYTHINVEYCEWSMMIKYLFKYIAKGTDRIIAQITRTIGDASTSTRHAGEFLGSTYIAEIRPSNFLQYTFKICKGSLLEANNNCKQLWIVNIIRGQR